VLLIGIDLSTTGVDIELDHAMDVALRVEELSGRVLFSHLWPVELPIDRYAEQLKAHGIVLASGSVEENHARIASVLDDVARRITEFVKRGGYIVGHNVVFDVGLFSLELKRYGLPLMPERVAPLVTHLIDTMPGKPGMETLESLCTKYKISPTGPLHRSDVDAKAAVDLAREMMRLGLPLTTWQLPGCRPIEPLPRPAHLPLS